MLLPLSIDEPLARSGSDREGLGGGEDDDDERELRSRHTRQKMAYWSYSFAAECFASAGMVRRPFPFSSCLDLWSSR